MKNKKIIVTVISIILITLLTTVSFAANSIRTGMTFDEAVEASRERNNKVKNETTVSSQNEVKNETVKEPTQNKVENETVKEPTQNKVENEIVKETTEDKVIDESKETEDKVVEKEEEGIVSFKETISEDIVKVQDKVEYKAINVDGNVYIVAENVVLKDFKVDGNLFITAVDIELNNVIIDGSLYTAAETVKIDGQISSAYIIADDIIIDESANIIKELRVACSNFEFEGSVGRDLYVYSEKVKVADKAEIYGDCIVKTATVEVSEDAKINGEKDIQIVENTNNSFTISNQVVYSQIIANCAIILIVAIFILYSSPKFVAVNGKLRLRDFVKSFFTGILELIFVCIIFVVLSYIGYGFGFGFALLMLSIILVYFGKMLFIISAGIRLAGKSENVSRIKSFFVILIVLVVVEAINLLQLTGMVGLLSAMAINLVLGITGFGSLVRVILTPSRKNKQQKVNPNNGNTIREVRPEDFVMKNETVLTPKKEVVTENVEKENVEIEKEVETVKEEPIKNEENKKTEDTVKTEKKKKQKEDK